MALTNPAKLSVEISMDTSEFLPGEPLLVGVAVENIGGQPFENLAPLGPLHGFLRFSASRGGADVPWSRGYFTFLYTRHDERILEAGERVCYVVDLLEYFGRDDSLEHGGRPYRLRMLDPGEYTLSARFRARLGHKYPNVEIISNELRFVIREASSIPETEWRVLDRIRVADRSERWGEDVALLYPASPYFQLVPWRFHETIDRTVVARRCLEQGCGTLKAVRLLRSQYTRFEDDLDGRTKWLDEVERHDSTDAFGCYLRYWTELTDRARRARTD